MEWLSDQRRLHMGADVYNMNLGQVFGTWQRAGVRSLGPRNPGQEVEFPILPFALLCHLPAGIDGVSYKGLDRRTTGQGQQTRVGNRGGVAKSGPEKMRERTSRNPAAEGESCRFGYLARSQPSGVSRRGHRKDVFTSCQSFLLGNPKSELRAESRDQG